MNLVRNAVIILAVICLTGSNAAKIKAPTVSDCICIDNYDPVSDTTGTTYSNMCRFNCARDDAKRSGRKVPVLSDGSGTS